MFLIKACSNNDFICAFAWEFERGKISSRTIFADSADTFDFISVPFNSHEEKKTSLVDLKNHKSYSSIIIIHITFLFLFLAGSFAY